MMTKEAWKTLLNDCFEKIRLIERCQKETRENFSQFCEFIAEPAFESLSEALKEYEIRAGFRQLGPLAVSFDICFPRSRVHQFSYIISLVPNSIQLKLELRLRGRKSKKLPYKEWTEVFLPQIPPDNVLTITQEDLMEDIIRHYRDFIIEVLTSPP